MDANLASIKSAVATVVGGVDGILGASASNLDAIPQTPYAVVGDPKSTAERPGTWEETEFTLPVTIFLAQTGYDPARLDAIVLPMVWNVKAAFRTNVGLSGLVTQCVVDSWDAGLYLAVGVPPAEVVYYRALEVTLRILIAGPATYTP